MLDDKDLRIVRESTWKDAIEIIGVSLSSFKPNDLTLLGTLPENIDQVVVKAQQVAHRIEKDIIREMQTSENTAIKLISVEVHSKSKDEKYRTYPYREYLKKLGLRFNGEDKADQFYYGEINKENFEKMKQNTTTIEVEIHKKKQNIKINELIEYLDWRVK